MYVIDRIYQEDQRIPSICCDNDNIKIIPIVRIYEQLTPEETPESIMELFKRFYHHDIKKVNRSCAWAFVFNHGYELADALEVYDNATQFWMLGDKIIVFTMRRG